MSKPAQKPEAKPAARPAPAAPTPRPGTREYREAQRADFGKRFEAAKRSRKS
jgi:hypothetical protein